MQAYIDAISPQYRPLFDRLHRLILEVRPDAVTALSYGMPGIGDDEFRGLIRAALEP